MLSYAVFFFGEKRKTAKLHPIRLKGSMALPNEFYYQLEHTFIVGMSEKCWGGRCCGTGTRLEFYYGAMMMANRADTYILQCTLSFGIVVVRCLLVCFVGWPWGWFLVYFSSFILLCILRKPFIQELNIKHTHKWRTLVRVRSTIGTVVTDL